MNEQEVLQVLGKVGAVIADSHIVYTSGKHGTAYVNKDAVYPAHRGNVPPLPRNRRTVRGRQRASGHRSGNRRRDSLAVDGAPSLRNERLRGVWSLRREVRGRRRLRHQAWLRQAHRWQERSGGGRRSHYRRLRQESGRSHASHRRQRRWSRCPLQPRRNHAARCGRRSKAYITREREARRMGRGNLSALRAERSGQHRCRQGARVPHTQASMNPQWVPRVRYRKVANPFSFCKISRSKFIAKTNIFSYSLFVFVFATVGANFSEARVRRNSSPQPPPSAAPERIWRSFKIASAIFQEMVSSRTVKIHPAGMAELVYALVLGTSGAALGSSSLPPGTLTFTYEYAILSKYEKNKQYKYNIFYGLLLGNASCFNF